MDSIEFYLDSILNTQPVEEVEKVDNSPTIKKENIPIVKLPKEDKKGVYPPVLPQLTKPSSLASKKTCIELNLILVNNNLYKQNKDFILFQESDIQKSNEHWRKHGEKVQLSCLLL